MQKENGDIIVVKQPIKKLLTKTYYDDDKLQ